MIDLARLTVGEIARVNAQLGTFVSGPALMASRLTQPTTQRCSRLRLPMAPRAVIHTSALVELAEREMEQQIVLHGDAGTLEVDLHLEGPSSGATIRGARRGQPKLPARSRFPLSYGAVSIPRHRSLPTVLNCLPHNR